MSNTIDSYIYFINLSQFGDLQFPVCTRLLFNSSQNELNNTKGVDKKSASEKSLRYLAIIMNNNIELDLS